MTVSHVITQWHPEDSGFWAASGRRVAARNLAWSAVALAPAFAVWMLWPVLVVHLPEAGFRYSANQLFWLAALPALSGATLRLFYAFAMPALGGRRFTALSTASLLVPALGVFLAVRDPATPYELMVLLALLAGLGGGNFASSTAHLRAFYAYDRQERALVMHEGLGLLGIPAAQLLVPLVVGAGVLGALGGAPQATPAGPVWLQNAGLLWVPVIAAAALAAWFGIDDVAGRGTGFAEQAGVVRRRSSWLACAVVTGTSGSFVGYAATLPLLAQTEFPQLDTTPLVGLATLAGALAHAVGSRMAERAGGARVTLWAFVAMAASALAAVQSLPSAGTPVATGGHPVGFFVAWALLLVAAGIGSGSAQRTVRGLFIAERLRTTARDPQAQEQATDEGHRDAVAALGLASAVGAYGAFVIPKATGTAVALTGGPAAALLAFCAFHAACAAATWWACVRRFAPMPC